MQPKSDEAGNLSLDFLAGFTIFMVAFIYVATLIPGLFLGLESKSIDYDAVAYRTGVILAEDPGMPYNDPSYGGWENIPDANKGDVLRFGLALSTSTPNILSAKKIDRFFNNTSFVYPDDYRSRAVFGDYPYQFNISIKIEGENSTRSIGDPLPEDYGYSRRLVKIKEDSSASIDLTKIKGCYWSNQTNDGETDDGKWNNTINSAPGPTTHPFSIYLNYTYLTTKGPYYNNPAYQIDPISPMEDGITVNVSDLDKTTRYGYWTATGDASAAGGALNNINLSRIYVTQSSMTPYKPPYYIRSPFSNVWDTNTLPVPGKLYIDDGSTPITSLSSPVKVNKSVSLVIPAGSFGLSSLGGNDPSTYLNITMVFTLDPNHGDWFLNSTQCQPYGAFVYDYDPARVNQPYLKNGTLEVAVW